MTSGTCYVCKGLPPICTECLQEVLNRWSGSARTFGWRWGAGLRIALDHQGEVSKTWPAWETEQASNVRRICRRIVEPLANAVPERRDARLVEAFAQVCAAAAEEAYTTLTLEEARLVVADYDRRFPTWHGDLIRRLRGAAL